MKITERVKKHNRGGLIGGLIYLSLGAISMVSYFMEKKKRLENNEAGKYC